MRINKFLASTTSLSRRAADTAIAEGRVTVNGQQPLPGQDIASSDIVTLDGETITVGDTKSITIALNKPRGYVVSRNGQGSRTIYDLLPPKYQALNPIGRLDKDSSGLILLTNDGQLANELTHPSRQKTKIYEVELDKPLAPLHHQMLVDYGVQLEDGLSKFQIEKIASEPSSSAIFSAPLYRVTMHEGRNRQIRRSFDSLGYKVVKLHRTHFGPYTLDSLKSGQIKAID